MIKIFICSHSDRIFWAIPFHWLYIPDNCIHRPQARVRFCILPQLPVLQRSSKKSKIFLSGNRIGSNWSSKITKPWTNEHLYSLACLILTRILSRFPLKITDKLTMYSQINSNADRQAQNKILVLFWSRFQWFFCCIMY